MSGRGARRVAGNWNREGVNGGVFGQRGNAQN